MMPGTLASVSTLSTSAGGATGDVAGLGHLDVARQPAAGTDVVGVLRPPRRRRAGTVGDAGERVAAVDGLEQRRLLAVEVLVGPLEHDDLDAVGPPGGRHLGHGPADPVADLGADALRPNTI